MLLLVWAGQMIYSHSYTSAPVPSAAHSPTINSRTQHQAVRTNNGDTSNRKRMLNASDTPLGWVVAWRASKRNSFKSFDSACPNNSGPNFQTTALLLETIALRMKRAWHLAPPSPPHHMRDRGNEQHLRHWSMAPLPGVYMAERAKLTPRPSEAHSITALLSPTSPTHRCLLLASQNETAQAQHAKGKRKQRKWLQTRKESRKRRRTTTSKRGIDQVDEEHADSKVAKVAKVVLGGMADPLPAVGNRLKDTVYICDGKYKRWNGKRLDPVCKEYEVYGCETLAQNGPFCKGHGGGKHCASRGCNTAARGGSQYCFAHGRGKRCKIARCTNPVSKNGRCRRHISKKRPRCNTLAGGAAVTKAAAPAANVEKVNLFQETLSPRVSALDVALEPAELIAADAMTNLSSAMPTLNEFLASLQPEEVDVLDALTELDTRTPPGALIGDEATALHMLVTMGEDTRGVRVGNVQQDAPAELPQVQAQAAGAVDTTALTLLAETAFEIVDMSD
jgi:hypothetical protein